VLAELANDEIGHWAETVASRLFPVMSFVFDMVVKPFAEPVAC
jgi:hypothetical protein